MITDVRHIIKSHIVTERTNLMKQQSNEYVFEVEKHANKYQIKEAIETAFKVKVDSVRTLIMPSKVKRLGRFVGSSPSWKKAVVRLKKDQSITMFENV